MTGVGGRWELYDMEADGSELNDLAGEHPRRVKAMAAKWYRIALSTDVIPMDSQSWHERIRNPTGKRRE